MFAATRRWFRRNRTPIAIGVGVVGAGYLVTQYIISKINDARERMSSDRVAKENLRRRFEQNQEDCTYTVLALLPTATANMLEAMNTEKITYMIQQMKGSGGTTGTNGVSAKSIGSASPPSLADTNATEDDGRSLVSLQSESGVLASQAAQPAAPAISAGTAGRAEPGQETRGAAPKVRKSKRQLWDELTISSITRAYTLLYTLGLLTMLTRIQLNLLGRRSYLSSVVSLATGSAQAAISLENNDDGGPEPTSTYRSDFEINQKYLTFSWWLLNRGWVDMMQRVESAVRHVFGHLSPRDTITLEHFARLTSDVRTMLEGSGARTGNGTKWLPLVLPTPDMEDFVLRESGILDNNARPLTTEPSTSPLGSSTSLRRLLDETADLVESPAFSTVLTQLLDAGFRVLIDKKLQAGAFAVTSPPGPAGPTTLDPQVDRAVLLPRVLSVLTRQAHAIGIGVPNEYLQEMETVRDLEGFAAVVYSSNWEAEITQDGDGIMTSAAHVGGRSAPSVQPSHLLDLDAVGESMIVVDPARSGLESAWEQATAAQQGFRR